MKLSNPRIDRSGKRQKYETPFGNGSRAYFPPIPLKIRQRIAQRYEIDVPDQGSFWDWLALHPEIPIVITEGGKKSLSVLSRGDVAIALYGVNGGYWKLGDGSRQLIDDLTRFATAGRQIVLAFDQDIKPITQRRVAGAISRFGGLLEQLHCAVTVATWQAEQGKGVDDLIVSRGASGWERAYRTAQRLLHWQIRQRLLERLTYPTSLTVRSGDLSSLDLSVIPTEGIIAIDSAKGTGKTKLISQMVATADKSLAVGHRIALMRNLSARLNLDYKGDLDKANGQFINGSAYTWRIGLCVDSLLAIDPDQFAGCDLILDEAVQVLRHLLTSSTCSKDGMRPALLARLQELIQAARRVIVADADLDNATLHCISSLRSEDCPIFLLRNDALSTGYPIRFIDCPDSTAVIGDLLKQIASLPPERTLYVSTDSKAVSKSLARLISVHHSDKRLLLINSETSGGELEREFICDPDTVLYRHDYDIIICSPSVGTGVSIEAQGIIDRVYGIFSGRSATDADMAQALVRVREPVERIVWCAKRGSNYSKVSRSTNPIELKQHLYERTSIAIRLIRSSLRPDTISEVEHYDWQANPYLRLYCQINAAQNYAMHHLREVLQVRLAHEGNHLTVEQSVSDQSTRSALSEARNQQKAIDASVIIAAADLSYTEVAALEQQERLSSDQIQALQKHFLKDFYCLETLTIEDILWDNEGRRMAEIYNLEAQLYPATAQEWAARSLEKQTAWKHSYCPWDLSSLPLRQALRSKLGIDDLLTKIRSGWQWTKYDLAPYVLTARSLSSQIKTVLHLNIAKMSDVQVIHQLLAQIGIHVTFNWSRSVPGHEGEKLRIYQIDQTQWQPIYNVIQKRDLRRSALAEDATANSNSTAATTLILSESGSPSELNNDFHLKGDPTKPDRGLDRLPLARTSAQSQAPATETSTEPMLDLGLQIDNLLAQLERHQPGQ